MESVKFFKSIFKGLIASIIVTVICMIILSIAMTKFELSDKSYNIGYVAVTCLGLVIGAVIAAKITEKKGWLVGLLVGICFFGFLILLSFIVNGELVFTSTELYKLIGCIVVGTIAGMLGVNL